MPILTETDACREALREQIERARRVLPFTGAGVSTESGIPDFRSPGSAWTRNKPIPFQAFVQSREARIEAWRRKFVMDESFKGAAPSVGHRAIARLIETGRAQEVVTQNIDGLHQAAGVAAERVIELHGNGTFATCLSCGRRYELEPIRLAFVATGEPPACACGGLVKSATISFGQAMPAAEMRRALDAAARADLVLCIGSSLVVYPAAGVPLHGQRNGARLVIVNREPTELDAEADLVLRGEIGALLRDLAAT